MIGQPIRVLMNQPLRARRLPKRFTVNAEVVKENRHTVWVRLRGGKIIQRRKVRDVA